jgi:peptidoglycan hydrolase-like protein with peptidoglycan-binding domain
MGTVAFLLFLILAARGQNQTPQQPTAPVPHPGSPQQPPPTAALPPPSAPPAAQQAATKAQAKAQQQPQPWPQVMPAGLPAFPAGWQADNPPPPAVVNRAWQLLAELWKSGAPGAYKTEQTAGRWITYQAQLHAGNKKGVTAYRLRSTVAPSSAPANAAAPILQASTQPAAPVSSAVLRQGSGMGALASQGPAVAKVQQALGIGADGKFGPGTKASVIAFQKKNGLTADGVVGPATRAKLGVAA